MRKNNYTRWILGAFFLLGATNFIACKDEVTLTPFEIKTEESDLTYLDNGGIGKMKVSGDEEWSVETDVEWCRITPVNGIGTTLCEVAVDSSYLYEERFATLTFHMGNSTRQVRISQFGYNKVIELDSTSFIVADFSDYDQMYRNLKVKSNVKYEVIIPEEAEWIRAKEEKRDIQAIPRISNVRFDYEIHNNFRADRVADIILRQTDAKAGETPVEAHLSFTQKAAQKITPSRAGDSLAILAVARGLRCYNSFDSSQPMIYWNNVKLEECEYIDEEGNEKTEMRVVGLQLLIFNTKNTIPYQIRYLDQLRTLILTGNENGHARYIELGDDVAHLPKLQSLGLVGYGATNIPEGLGNMKTLKALEFTGNHLLELPETLIKKLDANGLEYLNLAANQYKIVTDGCPAKYQNPKDSIGMTGTIPEFLFHLENVRYLYLSYNNFIGSIPDVKPLPGNDIVWPKMRLLGLNLNYMTGEIPEWMLNHPNLKCWDPYTMVFNQLESGYDINGNRVGFTNEPDMIEGNCPLVDSNGNWVEDVQEILTPASFDPDFRWHNYFNHATKTYPRLSLDGHWSGRD